MKLLLCDRHCIPLLFQAPLQACRRQTQCRREQRAAYHSESNLFKIYESLHFLGPENKPSGQARLQYYIKDLLDKSGLFELAKSSNIRMSMRTELAACPWSYCECRRCTSEGGDLVVAAELDCRHGNSFINSPESTEQTVHCLSFRMEGQ